VAAQARPSLEGTAGLGKYPRVAHRGLVMQLNGAVTDAVVR
jgi:hypothetical protein